MYIHIPVVPNRINRTDADKPYMNGNGLHCAILVCILESVSLHKSQGVYCKNILTIECCINQECYGLSSCNVKLLSMPMGTVGQEYTHDQLYLNLIGSRGKLFVEGSLFR